MQEASAQNSAPQNVMIAWRRGDWGVRDAEDVTGDAGLHHLHHPH